jgi:MscS family membrane protein
MSLTRTPLRLLPVLGLLLAPRASAEELHLPEQEEAELNAGLDPVPPTLDRSTPRRSWAALIDACRAGRWDLGAQLLNLSEVARPDRKVIGALLTRQLCEVLRSTGQRRLDPALDDTPLGPLSDERPRNVVAAARLSLPGVEEPELLRLRRIKDSSGGGRMLWLLAPKTVSQIATWHRVLVKKDSGRAPVERVNRGLGDPPAGLQLATPRDAIQSFVALTARGKLEAAAHLLDLSQVPEAEQARRGKRLARRLAAVLRRIHPGGYSRVSNDPSGSPEREVPLDEEVLAEARLEPAPVQIRLARHPLTRGAPVWLFSAATVGDIDALYERHGYGWIGDHLPLVFVVWQLAGIQLWQWLGLALFLVAALLVGFLTSFVTRRLLQRLSGLTSWRWDDLLVKRLGAPITLALAMFAFALLVPLLALSQGPLELLRSGCKLIGLFSLGWVLIRIVDVIGEHTFGYFKERADEMGMAMVPVARKILKPIILAILLVVSLQNLGMNVSGLLAGLGIAGLAISLAGKNTIENLFGSLVIAFDRPFKLGDTIKVGDLFGTVEDLGLRSTRLRTLDRTLVTIPNAQLADSKVENFSRRDRMRLLAVLGVRYETTADQLRLILDEIKRALLAHPRVWQEGFSVRFVGYGDSSLDLEVICYVTTADWGEFTGIREALLLELGAIVDRAGSEIAFPSHTIYMTKGGGLDAKLAKQASSTVRERLERGELCLPEIPEAVRTALRPPP